METVASILAAEGVLRHMTASSDRRRRIRWRLAHRAFHYARKYLYLNGEAIEVLHQPAAHTDSDVFVFFRRSDVVVAGDVLDTRRFPVIDVERGGSIEGEIAALNRLSRTGRAVGADRVARGGHDRDSRPRQALRSATTSSNTAT